MKTNRIGFGAMKPSFYQGLPGSTRYYRRSNDNMKTFLTHWIRKRQKMETEVGRAFTLTIESFVESTYSSV